MPETLLRRNPPSLRRFPSWKKMPRRRRGMRPGALLADSCLPSWKSLPSPKGQSQLEHQASSSARIVGFETQCVKIPKDLIRARQDEGWQKLGLTVGAHTTLRIRTCDISDMEKSINKYQSQLLKIVYSKHQ
ncbi:uncharacterized protein [Anolis sagrei]|uniref:uncharacterized protein isoform X2 n=1 Tax=Anolis sagrei TaxID=38937 RepID=UPI0035220AC8